MHNKNKEEEEEEKSTIKCFSYYIKNVFSMRICLKCVFKVCLDMIIRYSKRGLVCTFPVFEMAILSLSSSTSLLEIFIVPQFH